MIACSNLSFRIIEQQTFRKYFSRYFHIFFCITFKDVAIKPNENNKIFRKWIFTIERMWSKDQEM